MLGKRLLDELAALSAEDREAVRVLLSEVPLPAVSYRQRYVKCGRASCKCATEAEVHGPYWYAYWTEGGKTRSRYVGKTRPAEVTSTLAVAEPSSSPAVVPDGSIGKSAVRSARSQRRVGKQKRR